MSLEVFTMMLKAQSGFFKMARWHFSEELISSETEATVSGRYEMSEEEAKRYNTKVDEQSRRMQLLLPAEDAQKLQEESKKFHLILEPPGVLDVSCSLLKEDGAWKLVGCKARSWPVD